MFRAAFRSVSAPLKGVRTFAAKAKSPAGEKGSQPVQQYSLSGRYATALYNAASKKNQLKAVEDELKQLKSLIAGNKSFSQFLVDPSVARPRKAYVVEAVSKKAGFSDVTKNFFRVMAENGRLNNAEEVIKSFEELLASSRNEVEAVITSAQPLSSAQLESVKKSLNSLLSSGQTVTVSTKVDPSILGGLKVQVGERFVDLSVNSRIEKFRLRLAEAM
eukprot:GILI01001046.1.p1 GENE.GILI01001046.1~~GILI01001046.1.p1  ORF type:complete len:218 (-),score=95.40 GILI01001046.1:149-802(-)